MIEAGKSLGDGSIERLVRVHCAEADGLVDAVDNGRVSLVDRGVLNLVADIGSV